MPTFSIDRVYVGSRLVVQRVTMQKSSFQKKAQGKTLNIPGTKRSLHNNQLLVSTGIPSLDNLMGGGMAVGTVLVIEEDTFGSFSRLMLKYFLAEGVMCKHGILLSSSDVHPQKIIKDLPAPLVDDSMPVSMDKPRNDDLKIAWRYQQMPQIQTSLGATLFGNYYDLTKTMESRLLDGVDKVLHDGSICPSEETAKLMRMSYASLLKRIQAEIESKEYGTAQQPQNRNILRIGVHSLGSPQWGEKDGIQENTLHDHSLPRFLISLRNLLRQAFAVCVITMPVHLFHDTAFVRRIRSLSDTVLKLESFVGSDKEKNPVYKEYHGLFNIVKLPQLNSLTCHMPDSLDYAFKLKRKKFLIEKLHLPPELSNTMGRSDQTDPLKPAVKSIIHSTGSSKDLDF